MSEQVKKHMSIAVALSGGVDSLTAGYLLKEQGFSVFGIHFITGYESPPAAPPCPDPASAAADRIRPLVDRLGIELHIVDVRDEFEQRVVRYFVETYREGKTPNPCLVCNPAIKFQTVFDSAREMGAQKLATGHYARIGKAAGGSLRLLKGADRTKDQSYFLAFLTPAHLSRAVFPLGSMTKTEVKALARRKGLVPAVGESQDVCFIRGDDYKRFLSERDPGAFSPGPIVDASGKKIGEHCGFHGFTVGQRRGINLPAAEPYYVVRLDREQNRLVVGFKEALYAGRCRIVNVQWPGRPPEAPFRARTRIRYRHDGAASTVTPVDAETVEVAFDRPQAAVTPGQGAVFYQDDEVAGAGIIS